MLIEDPQLLSLHENLSLSDPCLASHYDILYISKSGEATHLPTDFTLISVGSYATLDLYNTPLLGNSGLLHRTQLH